MADALVWQLIRSHNSFLVKRGQTKRDGSVQFSSEPGNLLNVNTFKYSGIANSSIIAVNQSDKGVVLTKKDGKDINKPKKASSSSLMKANPYGSLKSLAASGLRGDMLSAATTRFKKLNRAVAIKKGLSKRPVVGKSRGKK